MSVSLTWVIPVFWGFGALSIAGTSATAADVNQRVATRDAALDAAFQLVRDAVETNHVPGAIALVARDGRVVRHQAFGLRDVENQLPFTTNTLCWIASITKPVTVAAAMTLVDAGKLALDDDVEKYLPEFRQQTNTNGLHQAFTIRHLMSHTSGLVPNPPTRRSGWPIGGPLDDFSLQQHLPEIGILFLQFRDQNKSDERLRKNFREAVRTAFANARE